VCRGGEGTTKIRSRTERYGGAGSERRCNGGKAADLVKRRGGGRHTPGMGGWGGKLPKRRPHTAARKIASRAACVGRQTARDPGFSDHLQLWGLAQVAWTDACCFARSSEPPDPSNGLCFRPKWTSMPPDPAFSWIPGPKKLDIQLKFPVGFGCILVTSSHRVWLCFPFLHAYLAAVGPRLVECAPNFGALVHNAPLSALLSAQCALSAPKAPVVALIND